MATHRIAVIPGDGIGKETVPEGLRVLEAVAKRFGIDFRFQHFAWDCDHYLKHGRMMPEDWYETLKPHDAIFYGAVGWPATVPDQCRWGFADQVRRFDQYVNLRPCRLIPGIRRRSRCEASDIDFVDPQNTEGSTLNQRAHVRGHRPRDHVRVSVLAQGRRPDHEVHSAQLSASPRSTSSATKSNGISITMPYWDER
jgi:tartrate dehydrogenase/decarboxylase/D-malate dehydrogenase